jgi:hypothetical protein
MLGFTVIAAEVVVIARSLKATRQSPSLRGVRRTTKQSIVIARSLKGDVAIYRHCEASVGQRGNPSSLRGASKATRQSPSLRGVHRTTKQSIVIARNVVTWQSPSLRGVRRTTKQSTVIARSLKATRQSPSLRGA